MCLLAGAARSESDGSTCAAVRDGDRDIAVCPCKVAADFRAAGVDEPDHIDEVPERRPRLLAAMLGDVYEGVLDAERAHCRSHRRHGHRTRVGIVEVETQLALALGKPPMKVQCRPFWMVERFLVSEAQHRPPPPRVAWLGESISDRPAVPTVARPH